MITRKKQIDQLNMVYDEYKYRENALKQDFTNLYTSLSISIAFYGTIIAFISTNIDMDIFILYSFLFFLTPIFTYIFGLLYCYNLFAITKGGCITTTLEKRIREIQIELYKKADYVGWGIAETKKNIGRVLVYGTILMFYILLPILSIIFGIITVISEGLSCISICFIVVSVIFYTIYIIFIITIFLETKKFYNSFQENHNYGSN